MSFRWKGHRKGHGKIRSGKDSSGALEKCPWVGFLDDSSGSSGCDILGFSQARFPGVDTQSEAAGPLPLLLGAGVASLGAGEAAQRHASFPAPSGFPFYGGSSVGQPGAEGIWGIAECPGPAVLCRAMGRQAAG